MNFPKEEILEFNKFSYLHDGERVFFSKIDRNLQYTLDSIREKQHECILITGNSDYGHYGNFFDSPSVSSNLKHWFCTNKCDDDDRLTVLPLGTANVTQCKLGKEHGLCWPKFQQKHNLLSTLNEKKPTKLVYANFETRKRHHARKIWQNIAHKSPHITWTTFESRSLSEFYNDILDHEAVLCPLGNNRVPEGDNHRVYETLYCGRIPITHAENYYRTLYHLFPIILIPETELEAIDDEQFIRREIQKIKSKKFDLKYLKFSYWKNIILKAKKDLK
tara:strand:- start:3330 stop:4157 length:828 start_codon:yes stop_codon:yes gene_type:complete